MLDSLRHFLLVAEHGTFTEAARRAHLSQPALSASMRRLEEDLGAELFNRGRKGAELTAAGRALLPHAQATLTALEDGRRAVQSIGDLSTGEVRIGAGATACTYLLPKVLAAFRQKHPGIRFQLREMTTDESLDALQEGSIDLGIISHPSLGDLWLEDPLVLVRGPSYAPAGEHTYVTFREGATTRTLFDRHFPEANIVMELHSIAAVKGNVRAGIGMALVSANAITEDLRRGKLIEATDPRVPIVRQLRVTHRGIGRLSPAATAFRQALLSSGSAAAPASR